MAKGGDTEDKTEEPTETRLREARNKGDVVYSTEVGSALSLLTVTMIAMFLAGPMMGDIGDMSVRLLANADRPVDPGALWELFATLLLRIGAAIGLASLFLMLAGVASRLIQDKFVFTGERMKPQIERINPVDGFQRVFGIEAFAQFVKSSAKLIVVGAVIIFVLWPDDATLAMLPYLDVAGLWAVIAEKSFALLIACVIAVSVIAMGDYLYTRYQHRKRLRMSRYDLKQEFKQNEGSPEVRAKLRQIRMEKAARRMMQQVPRASVVITNPTHFAVALRYDKEDAPAPICLAKGVDEVALKIRALAEEHSIPIVEDPPLARALYASADLDEVIPREHFEPVAKIIGYIMQLAERRRGRGRAN
jgi:flagellar biosynthetic protein FlhB